MILRDKKHIIIMIFIIIISSTYSQAISLEKKNINIDKKEIINQGLLSLFKDDDTRNIKNNIFLNSLYLIRLEKWFNNHQNVEFASLIGSTITIKFLDGSYILLLDIFSIPNIKVDYISNYKSNIDRGPTALILNPSEYLYGDFHCRRIIKILHTKGYNFFYIENKDVDLQYIKTELKAEIVYMNTHAGYWDIDGDNQGDSIVIATGEYWTNNTIKKYQFEYENQMIVEGMVGNKSFVAFTPNLIDYYYESEDFPNSLIYMATCHATYDDSMANAFLESGASAYMGWSRDTVSWINKITSVIAFRLFIKGFSIMQVCNLIRYGGFLNFLFKSKLVYFGNGNHIIQKY
jgi:hypothetical protein